MTVLITASTFLYFALKLQQNEVTQVQNKSEKIVKYHSQQIVMRQNVTVSKNCSKRNPTQCVFRRASKHCGQFSEGTLYIKNIEKRAINAIFFQ